MIKYTPGWAWLILVFINTVFVVGFDLRAYLTHTETMTGRFRDWLFDPVTGPFIFGGWVGLFVGLTFHWFLRGRR